MILTLLLIAVDQVIRLIFLHLHLPLQHGNREFVQSALVLVLVATLYFILARRRALNVLVAGSVSNCISSFLAGGIIDYIPFGPLYTNCADLLITGGAIWCLVGLVRRQRAW